jgi:hypothetical protein
MKISFKRYSRRLNEHNNRVKGKKAKVTPKQAYVALRGPGG